MGKLIVNSYFNGCLYCSLHNTSLLETFYILFDCSLYSQLAGEAQELFSVRHGPVRAARILPAPHISE